MKLLCLAISKAENASIRMFSRSSYVFDSTLRFLRLNACFIYCLAVRKASTLQGAFLGPTMTYDAAEEKKEMFKNIDRQESQFPGFGDKNKIEEEIEAQKKQQAEELEHEYVQASDEEKSLRVAIWDYGGSKVLHSVVCPFASISSEAEDGFDWRCSRLKAVVLACSCS